MSILAVKTGDLGDVILVTPALRALHHSVGPVDLLTYPYSANMIREAPFVRRVYAADRNVALNPLSWTNPERRGADLALLHRMRRERYDAIVFFHHLTTWRGTARWTILSSLIGSPVRIGLDNGRGRFLTSRTVDRGFGSIHEADYWFQLAAVAAMAFGARGREPTPTVLWNPASVDDERWASEWHRSTLSHEPFVVVHPGGGDYISARRWPIEQYARLLPLLVRAGFRPVVVGSRGERELCTSCISTEVAATVDMCGQTSVGQMGALLAQAEGFVGNDSFPMHLSAAANRPTVGIFGPTNAKAWGPWPTSRPWFRVVQSPTWCQPCAYIGHSMGRRDGCLPRPCLTGITPERVVKALNEATALYRSSDLAPPA